MKIVLNGFSVVYPMSGIGQYTIHLGKTLEGLLGDKNILWFGRNGSRRRAEVFNSGDASVYNRIQHHMKKGLRKIPGLKPLLHFWRNNQFQSYVQKVKPSLYHETNYAPFYFEHGPTLITIYDLSFVRHPEWHPMDRVKFFEKYCLGRLSRINAIITISEFSKREILDLLSVDPAKIYITPLGVDQSFALGKKRMQGLPDQYILFLGNLEPRKNLPRLISAHQSLPRHLRRKYPLVIAGAKGWDTKEIKNIRPFLQRDEKTIFIGYIPQSSLPRLYGGASLFVYPSLYEGFGLPVLEAMASGVPVITSCSTSLPEVVGDAGVLVNPYDVDHLKEAMRELLEDERKRGEMVKEGIARAKLFSWEKCARETFAVYEKVLGEGI